MRDLNLQILFNQETRLIIVENTSTFKHLFNLIRQVYKQQYPGISNKKLIIFIGSPPVKIYEHDMNQEITLDYLKIPNNSILNIEIDLENYIPDTFLQNPNLIVAQQKELEKYAENKNNQNKIIDKEKKEIEIVEDKSSKEISNLSNIVKEGKIDGISLY